MKPRRRNGRAAGRASTRRPPLPVSKFARALAREWRRLQLPVKNETVVVAVSGGADSVALLLALHELIKANKLNLSLLAAHIDHQLRKKSTDDARWVKDLARQLGLDISVRRVAVAARGENLEQSARRARYQALAQLAQKHEAGIVLTAHTMDDQAETVLLNLLRGSGSDGLSAMEPVRFLNASSPTALARPLLSWARRRDTEGFCRDRKIEFRHDEMNEDETFARVRVRNQLLPQMGSFNARIVEALTRTASLLREDSQALNNAAGRLLDLSRQQTARRTQLRIDLLAGAPSALRRRALRLWLAESRGDLRRLELAHLRAVEELITKNRGGRTIELPGGSTVSLKQGLLTFNRRTSGRSKA